MCSADLGRPFDEEPETCPQELPKGLGHGKFGLDDDAVAIEQFGEEMAEQGVENRVLGLEVVVQAPRRECPPRRRGLGRCVVPRSPFAANTSAAIFSSSSRRVLSFGPPVARFVAGA